jgi:DNA-binding NarL/FixJ family response regulator
VAGIRTVMVTTPALLGDLIRRLAVGHVELDIVAELSGRRALAKQLQQLRPHLVIIGLRENETDALIRALLAQLPSSKFIALTSDGRSIVGYELRLNRISLSNSSPDDLIDFVGAITADLDI